MTLCETRTYCNPLPIPAIPRGTDGWFDHETKPATVAGPDYRSISDPTVLYHGGRWYLYPSYGMAYVSDDFVTWKHVPTEPRCMKYSPAIIPWDGRFLLTGWGCPLYVGDSPLGPFSLLGDFVRPDGTHFKPTDPALFRDDDGRIYLYWFGTRSTPYRRIHCTHTLGAELDRRDPRRLLGEPVVIHEMAPQRNWWERYGQYNQDTRFGWVEGQHMLKVGGRYYMIYSSAGTQFGSYAMAAYRSDEGPLSGFVCQTNNPITFKRHGLVNGAGHGCIERGPGGTFWAFYTCTVSYAHVFERRIGMDLIAINHDGELWAPHGVTETPQYGPGVVPDAATGSNDPGLYPLTTYMLHKATASSAVPGRDPLYALDESPLTWWEPQPDDPAPRLEVSLDAPYITEACRLFWRDRGLDYDHGAAPGPYRYLLEGRPDNGRDEWVTLLDCRANDTDYNIDYRTFPPVVCEAVRLTITGWPEGLQPPGVIGFTVFGRREMTL